MHKPIRFIHSADLHLDSLFKTKGHLDDRILEQLRESTFHAFDKLVQAAIEHEVDFVLITGDLYNEENRSLKAQVHLREGFKRLKKFGIPVFLSYGNHDFTKGMEDPIEFPDNVHIFRSENVEHFIYEKQGEPLAHIYGFSYETKAVEDRKALEYKRTGAPAYHIGMLHGSLDSNSDHDVYAPFTISELRERDMDYWALGHIHKRSILSEDPPIVYSGNIQGRSMKEQGEKGCYLVENKDGTWSRSFLPLHTVTFVAKKAACLSDHPQAIEQALDEAKSQVGGAKSAVMLEVTLTAEGGVLKRWAEQGTVDEWVEVLNEAEDVNREDWIWIDRVVINDQPGWEEAELRRGNHFPGELLKISDEIGDAELEEWLAPVFQHRKIAKYAAEMSSEERLSIMQEAKALTIDRLWKGEDSE
ncbi:DNA repair exonuclease [Halobacillus sp. ACCC02827]|uniref:metallophosphoesterase family protein n=1 Tax=Halobacillus sp. ACCC02827 TaxID=3052090 RepID=UPI0025712F74|nr:DNA repair exonuclease [Halobacillus sp. ACCC02827]WJE16772.1 DNA repair exonuclease [Halobacillus sp. ACCC02827]